MYGSIEIEKASEVKKRLARMNPDDKSKWCSYRWDYLRGRLTDLRKIDEYKLLCKKLGKAIGE